MPDIGPLEIVIVLVIVLLIFGPKRLPDLGRSLGRGMREFKDSVTGRGNGDGAPRIDQQRAAQGSVPGVPPAATPGAARTVTPGGAAAVPPAPAGEESARATGAANPTNAS